MLHLLLLLLLLLWVLLPAAVGRAALGVLKHMQLRKMTYQDVKEQGWRLVHRGLQCCCSRCSALY
jgi:hypothetical protein